jgi:hypothetical protein
MKTDEKVLLTFVGLAVVGGIIYFATKKPAVAAVAAATPTPVLPGPTPANVTPTGGPVVQHIVVAAGFQNVMAPIGNTISLELPPGGAWQAGGTGVMPAQVGTATPITWVYSGPGTIILNWSSPTMGSKQTQITFQTM